MAGETVAHQPNLVLRNGTFYLRIRVPLDLVGALGRTHIVRSLRTKERKQALSRFRLEQARVERDFASARRDRDDDASLRRVLAAGRIERLSRRDLETLTVRWFERAVQRVAPGSSRGDATRFIDWDEILSEIRNDTSVLQSPKPADYAERVQFAANQVLLEAGFPAQPDGPGKLKRHIKVPAVDRQTEQYRELEQLVRRCLLELNQRQIADLTGQRAEAVDPLFDTARRSHDSSPKRTLNALISEFEKDPGRGARTGKTNTDYRMVFTAMREIIGPDTEVQSISREHTKRVRDLFLALPPNATKRFPGMTLLQAGELAQRNRLATLNIQTINSHLTKMSTMFNWAIKEEWIGRNPASGLAIDEVQKNKREPFDLEQLRAIFSAPIYAGCQDDEAGYAKPGGSHPRRARFWVPLLSLFHGLRLNEACQLRVEDLAERNGITVLHVRAADADQRIKSKAGTRIVPLHPEVIKIGFVDYVRDLPVEGDGRIFPELQKDTRGYYSDAFQKWFSRFLHSCGAAKTGTKFHSFRHGWADRLREAGVPEDRRRALGGWASTGADAGYGKGFPTRILAEDIAKVEYRGLDLKFLHA
ncbi:site-specific integrase [Methylobacterium nodulans]|uniref:Integrase family protein n=1 Tax=Methylobacterium nodulans (strain LMG 21967 / CNCM I-2342 / ORS 2060) TaxID=460265 RepID=B8IMR7_METNO|nr:site-specific integrase [Methylobacterium nodulans]ACL60260.1 integrase family protein [Methylobacterium nodulans ORS 2060]